MVAEADAAIDRRQTGEQLAEEAERLSGDLRAFVRAAWSFVVPRALIPNWHIDAYCDHLAALYAREIQFLAITVPPGMLKSTIVSVLGPVWRWTSRPEERIVSASWHEPLAVRDTRKSRMLIQQPWFQQRWGYLFSLMADENLKGRYSNDLGGHRIATHVGGGTGERGDVLLIDDPHNAKEAQTSQSQTNQLGEAREWYGDTWASRLNDSVDAPGAMCVIGQRVHEDDLIGHILAGDADSHEWTHLCLPGRYYSQHPYIYPRTVKLPSGRVLQGDPRTDGELLAPDYMDEKRLARLERTMTTHIAAGQIQQLPAAREGDLLKRAWWRYYPPQGNEETDAEFVARLPAFRTIVQSWDTPLKEKETSDLIAGQCYGVHGADRYLLDLIQGHMNFSAARRSVLEMAAWARELWPDAMHKILIEKGGYGLDLIQALRREITGIQEIPEKGQKLPDKFSRAESASAALEHGNVFAPGYGLPEGTGPDEARCPAMTVGLIATAAAFPNARYKDPVDSWSQAMNYLDRHAARGMRSSVPKGTMPLAGGIPR